jgi:hypothetical protein
MHLYPQQQLQWRYANRNFKQEDEAFHMVGGLWWMMAKKLPLGYSAYERLETRKLYS